MRRWLDHVSVSHDCAAGSLPYRITGAVGSHDLVGCALRQVTPHEPFCAQLLHSGSMAQLAYSQLYSLRAYMQANIASQHDESLQTRVKVVKSLGSFEPHRLLCGCE